MLLSTKKIGEGEVYVCRIKSAEKLVNRND